uniref:Cytochrome c oxidase subunit 5A, mitochondrial n=1 Tax=Sarcophilus harrisii TaxID=9305 RepID=A0A7N4NJM5_SARHA
SSPESICHYSHGFHEANEEFTTHWVIYFNKLYLHAWKLCKGMNTLVDYDLVLETKTINAIVRACRLLDDFVKTVQAGPHKVIYSYIIQEVRPIWEFLHQRNWTWTKHKTPVDR